VRQLGNQLFSIPQIELQPKRQIAVPRQNQIKLKAIDFSDVDRHPRRHVRAAFLTVSSSIFAG